MFDAIPKAWGVQRKILRRDSIHVDEIEVRPGGYCSVHQHERKHNIFQVLHGRLLVLTFNHRMELVRTDDLQLAGHCLIRAGWHHQFWSQGGCVAQEVYYGTQDGNLRCFDDDIVRVPGLDQGGLCLTLDALPSMMEPVHA